MSYVLEGFNKLPLIGTGLTLTSGSVYSMTLQQTTVIVNKTVGSATTVILPFDPILWVAYVVKDGKGDASTNNITVTPVSGQIDGAATAVLNNNYASFTLVNDGNNWSIV